jgi:hypothetical protein
MAGGAAGAADVGGWRRPGDVDADGLRRLNAEDWDAPAVRRAMDVFRDPNATGLQRWAAQEVLLDAGGEGPWQGGMSVEQAGDGPEGVLRDVEWNPSSKRWHATADVEIGGQVYKKGQFVPDEAVHPLRKFGVSAEMERAVMENLPGGRILALRDRPLGAAELDKLGVYDAKKGWVEDWMIFKKREGGIRELIDAQKVISGEYEHVTPARKWNPETGTWEQGYNFRLGADPDAEPVFVSEKKLRQFLSDAPPTTM